jgi:acyl-CoA synthetase (AMP-forming)/AMP-acid ligase II
MISQGDYRTAEHSGRITALSEKWSACENERASFRNTAFSIISESIPFHRLLPLFFSPMTPTEARERAIFDFCSKHLPPYKRIRCLEFATLPKAVSGKIRRDELRALEAEPPSKNERAVCEFWLDEELS